MFDGGREIDDALAIRRGTPCERDGVDHALGKRKFGTGKHLGRILEHEFGFRLGVSQVSDHRRVMRREFNDLVIVHAQYHPPHHRRHSVVQVNNRTTRAAQRFERSLDQWLTRLRENLDRHILGNEIAFDQQAHEVEIGLRGRREPYLDLLETDAHQHLEHAQLALCIHRFDQRLVAITEIGAQPNGRARKNDVRPSSVGQGNGREGAIFEVRLRQHGRLQVRKIRVESVLD